MRRVRVFTGIGCLCIFLGVTWSLGSGKVGGLPGEAQAAGEAAPSRARPGEKVKAPPKAAADTAVQKAPRIDEGLTEDMRRELGAAAWIPDDASYYSSTLLLGEQWRAFVESRALKEVLALPAVQMGLAQLRSHPLLLQILDAKQKDPLFASALDVGSDALSREVFFYADASLVRFFSAIGRLYLGLLADGFRAGVGVSGGARQGGAAPLSPVLQIIPRILEDEGNLVFPSVVLGFRLARPEAARSLLADFVKRFGARSPVPFEEQGIAGGRFHVARFSARLVPPEVRQDLDRRLQGEGLSAETVKRFNAFLDSRTLAMGAGVRDGYLLLCFGPDLEHLKKLGQGKSLAQSKALAPLRRHLKPRVASLVYAESGLASAGKLPVEELVGLLGGFLATLPAEKIPEGLVARLKKDAQALLEDANRFLPDDAPFVSVSFLNRGLETLSFASPDPTLDARKPLSIFSRAGKASLAVIAGRSQKTREAYASFAKWVGVAYGYFEEYVVPRIPEADRKDVELFRKVFVPAIRKLGASTESLLIPAIEDCQDLLVVDGGGVLSSLPGERQPLPVSLKYPRPAFLLELNDPGKLQEAAARYRETLNQLFQQVAKETGSAALEVPPPLSREHAGGKLYTYRLPFSLGQDFEPHALISAKCLFLSLSPAQSKSMAESSTPVPESLVDLAAPAAMAYWVDLRGLLALLLDDVGSIVELMAAQGSLAPDSAQFLGPHLVGLKKALGALKSYSGRVYVEGGIQIHHSWLQVEDLAHE